jgi:hypothetical protein
MALVALFGSGCISFVPPRVSSGPSYRPSNFFRFSSELPPQIRRLAVLPMSVEPGDWQAEEGRTALEAVLYSELGKVKAFELVAVTPTQLQQWTGKPCWTAQEKLPPEFFDDLQTQLGCDAVLFAHLRPYHAYKPLIIGWNLKLVWAKYQTIVWSADEVFDASSAPVARAAQDYAREHVAGVRPVGDSDSLLSSPRSFSQYTLSALLATLPER